MVIQQVPMVKWPSNLTHIITTRVHDFTVRLYHTNHSQIFHLTHLLGQQTGAKQMSATRRGML